MKNARVFSLATVTMAMVFGFAACDSMSKSPLQSSSGVDARARVAVPCGAPEVVALIAGQHIDAGTVTVMNDGQEVTVEFRTSGDWYMSEVHLHIGLSLGDIPQNRSGNPQIGRFAYKETLSPASQYHEFTVDLGENGWVPGTELYIAAHAVVGKLDAGSGNLYATETGWGEGPGFTGNSWAMYFKYTINECAPPPPDAGIQPGDFRTQTQGGWGTAAQGGNPGAYRDANFAAAFPDGLVVGGPNTAAFTSSYSVQQALPTGGTAGALAQSYVNPVTSEAGVLLGQVVALSLSVGFDLYDPNFGASSTNLKDLVVASGTFAGITVEQVLAEANTIIGGGWSSYSASQINDAVSAINENFVDGTAVGSYLVNP